jgi:hypothetical protein
MLAQRPATPIARPPHTSATTRGGAKSSETGSHSPSLPSGYSNAGDSLPSKPPGLPYTRTRRASATRKPSRDTSLTTIDTAAHILAAPSFGPCLPFPQHFRGLLRAKSRRRWLSSESQISNPMALLGSHSHCPPLPYQYSNRYSKIATHPEQNTYRTTAAKVHARNTALNFMESAALARWWQHVPTIDDCDITTTRRHKPNMSTLTQRRCGLRTANQH